MVTNLPKTNRDFLELTKDVSKESVANITLTDKNWIFSPWE